MGTLSVIHRFYWRAFNALIRLVSILFVLGAIGLLIGALRSDGADRILLLVLSVVIGTPAVLMLRAKAYRPDLDGFGSAFGETTPQLRTWWTGEPATRSHQDVSQR
jgi:hypothetical protein